MDQNQLNELNRQLEGNIRSGKDDTLDDMPNRVFRRTFGQQCEISIEISRNLYHLCTLLEQILDPV